MRTILVANPKGGSGKTTLATNLAGYFASKNKQVVLADLDRQQSSMAWLSRRTEKLPKIEGINARTKGFDSTKADWMIIDSPAGLHGDKLSDSVKTADWVVVPMQSSSFDIGATADFLKILIAEKAIRKERTFVAMVGMRIDSRTKAASNLTEYLAESGFPVMGCLRDAQVYVRAAEQGASFFDMRPSMVAKDVQQWASLLHWIMHADRHG